MYQIKVGDNTYQVSEKDGAYDINGEQIPIKIIKSDGSYNLVLKNKVVSANIISNDESKSWLFEIDGQKFNTVLKDDHDLLLEKMGLDTLLAAKAADIKAPMPGLVLDILIEVGTEVKKGEPLLILEAMKMENIIKAPTDGTVRSIKVNKAQAVEKNQVLVAFD